MVDGSGAPIHAIICMYMCCMHFMGHKIAVYVNCRAWQAKLLNTKQNTHKLRINEPMVTLVHHLFMTSFHHLFLCLIAMAIMAMNIRCIKIFPPFLEIKPISYT